MSYGYVTPLPKLAPLPSTNLYWLKLAFVCSHSPSNSPSTHPPRVDLPFLLNLTSLALTAHPSGHDHAALLIMRNTALFHRDAGFGFAFALAAAKDVAWINSAVGLGLGLAFAIVLGPVDYASRVVSHPIDGAPGFELDIGSTVVGTPVNSSLARTVIVLGALDVLRRRISYANAFVLIMQSGLTPVGKAAAKGSATEKRQRKATSFMTGVGLESIRSEGDYSERRGGESGSRRQQLLLSKRR